VPASGAPSARLLFATYCASLAIASGSDATIVLDRLRGERGTSIDPDAVAHILFSTIPLGCARIAAEWASLWDPHVAGIDSFLVALARHPGVVQLASAVRRQLEQLIVQNISPTPPRIQLQYAMAIEVDTSQPIPDVRTAGSIEWLTCHMVAGGTRSLGTVELPVFDGFVPARVLGDAIASEHGWLLLESFLNSTVYPSLSLIPEQETWSIFRGDVCLCRSVPGDQSTTRARLHQLIGWFVFLQEIWGHPDWSPEQIYNAGLVVPDASTTLTRRFVEVEIGDPLTNIRTTYGNVRMLVRF